MSANFIDPDRNIPVGPIAGYAGRRCGDCSDGFYAYDGSCKGRLLNQNRIQGVGANGVAKIRMTSVHSYWSTALPFPSLPLQVD